MILIHINRTFQRVPQPGNDSKRKRKRKEGARESGIDLMEDGGCVSRGAADQKR